MNDTLRCWKRAVSYEIGEKDEVLTFNGEPFTRQAPTPLEKSNGEICLKMLYIERKYKVQSAGLGKVCYDYKTENLDLKFDELIFEDEICVAVYHDGLIFLLSDGEDHCTEKYLGEMPTGPDQSVLFYDYYYLRVRE